MEEGSDFSDKLKEIFDLCDIDKDGFIDVQHFQQLAKEHFGAEGIEEVTGIITLLDPEGRGVIGYDDFCQGIQQILEIQSQATRNNLKNTGSISEETLVPLDIAGDLSVLQPQKGSPSSGSHTTFGEYDVPGLDDLISLDAPRPANGTGTHSPSHTPQLPGTPILVTTQVSEDEGDSAISGKSSEVNESRQEITDEENYEDFGEIESEADASDPGQLTPISRRKISEKKESTPRQHKKTPKHRLLTTAAALANQLQRSARNSPNSTRRSSLGSDEIFDDIDGNFQDVHGRLQYLEDQLTSLTVVQSETNTKQTRLKDENTLLVQKVHYLEEQLRDMELRAEERLTDERRKHQEYMNRHDREKQDQVDYLTQRLHRIEQEYESLKEEAPRLKAEMAKLRTEKMDIQERLLERQENYNTLYEEHERLKVDYHRQEKLQQKERNATGQEDSGLTLELCSRSVQTSRLLDEMGRELEDLRRYKLEVEAGNRSPSGSVSELPGRYRDLQNEIHKLKEENRSLHDSNEELNAQLLNKCIGEGKSLINSSEGQSLAEELEHLTKEELLEQLRIERDINLRLKQYVDRIIITILEKNPSLLEITNR